MVSCLCRCNSWDPQFVLWSNTFGTPSYHFGYFSLTILKVGSHTCPCAVTPSRSTEAEMFGIQLLLKVGVLEEREWQLVSEVGNIWEKMTPEMKKMTRQQRRWKKWRRRLKKWRRWKKWFSGGGRGCCKAQSRGSGCGSWRTSTGARTDLQDLISLVSCKISYLFVSSEDLISLVSCAQAEDVVSLVSHAGGAASQVSSALDRGLWSGSHGSPERACHGVLAHVAEFTKRPM